MNNTSVITNNMQK